MLEVPFDITNIGSLLGGMGTLSQVGLCPSQIGALSLNGDPSGAVGEGHLGGDIEPQNTGAGCVHK